MRKVIKFNFYKKMEKKIIIGEIFDLIKKKHFAQHLGKGNTITHILNNADQRTIDSMERFLSKTICKLEEMRGELIK